MDWHASGQAVSGGGGTLKEPEHEELARLRREKAELVKQHARSNDRNLWICREGCAIG
ncbi:hypothetical protein [Microtetraspora malaysiensis]|uniref:hypothetical protein n=1 Tax=Microtetraspora malaysiensis TaxID=161358 RepID=UPI003D90E07D